MRLAAEYPVSLVCRILEYPRSSYYYQAREPDDRALQEASLRWRPPGPPMATGASPSS
jgi:hypothetical protein